MSSRNVNKYNNDKDYGKSRRDKYDHKHRSCDEEKFRSVKTEDRYGNKRRREHSRSSSVDHKRERRHTDSDEKSKAEKEKPNYKLSGALAKDANNGSDIVRKYTEPSEARKPKRRWRLYPFKGDKMLPILHIHRQSCYLVGRDRKVVDIPIDHPSSSKQHAVLQYRLVSYKRNDESMGKRVRLYIMDLDSANGTFLNNIKIDARRYYELMEKDVIKFGFSSREFVVLHENSKGDQEDDDLEVTS